MVRVVSDILTGPLPGTQDSDIFAGLTSGIVSAEIDAEADADLIIGRNINANGIGINQSLIDAGPDDDQVWGLATGEGSVGIIGGATELGTGDDVLVARGTQAGVIDALIDGGTGNDRFNIQDGTGLIVGGTGEDTLVLSGMSENYSVTPIDDLLEIIQITGGVDGNTDLTVGQVETLIFQDPSGSTETFNIPDFFS